MPSKATNLTLVVRRSVPADGVEGDSKTALFVGLVQAHVDPGPVLLVKRFVYRFVGALFVEGVEERSSGRKTKKRFVSQRVVQKFTNDCSKSSTRRGCAVAVLGARAFVCGGAPCDATISGISAMK